MTRILFPNRFRSHFGPKMAIGVMLGLSFFGLPSPTPCQAAKLSTYLTAKDLASPGVLDQNGTLLNRGSSRHEASGGSTPTYVAFALHGGEHLPAGITTIAAGSTAGETTVGPLDFDSTLKANLNAALASSATGMAIVDTPKQNYLVEYLPRYAHRVQTWLATEAPGIGQTTTTTTTASHSTKVASSSAINELSRLLSDGQSTMTNWSAKGVAEMEKLLHINSTTKPTATKPSLNLEAQVIDSAHPLESPVPEPSTWLVFSLILGVAGLRQRLRRTCATASAFRPTNFIKE